MTPTMQAIRALQHVVQDHGDKETRLGAEALPNACAINVSASGVHFSQGDESGAGRDKRLPRARLGFRDQSLERRIRFNQLVDQVIVLVG